MRWGKKKGRIAAGFSVSLHAAVYVGLAAGGFFTVLQHYSRQPNVTDVMIYNAGDMAGAGGNDADGMDAVSRDGSGDYDEQEVVSSTSDKAPNEEVRPTVDATPLTPDVLTYAAANDESRQGSSDAKGKAEAPRMSGQPVSSPEGKTSGPRHHHGKTGPSGRRAAGHGTKDPLAPSGNLHVPHEMADLLDRVKALLPNKLSEARVDAPKEPTIPHVQANQSNTTIITAKEMDEHRDTSVRQALQRITGVTVNEMVPGISSYVKLNGDDRVLILVDGQSLANAQ